MACIKLISVTLLLIIHAVSHRHNKFLLHSRKLVIILDLVKYIKHLQFMNHH